MTVDLDGHLVRLAQALTDRGLTARMLRDGRIRAWNPASEPSKDNPRGQLLSSGLHQVIACQPREGDVDGAPWWHWVWTGLTRHESELEPLCPADEIERAADRVAVVLAVRNTGSEPSV